MMCGASVQMCNMPSATLPANNQRKRMRRYPDGNYRLRPGDWLIMLIGIALLVGCGAVAFRSF